MKHTPVVVTLLILSSLLLAACGGNEMLPQQPPQPPPPGEAAISGTVTAPPGIDLAGTTIRACLDAACQTPAQTVSISQSAQSAPFTLGGLQSGTSYTLVALQDTDGNGVADAGEASGSAGPIPAPAQGITLTLQGGNQPPPPPPPPADQGSVSGTLSAPAGSDLSDTLVAACFNGDCNDERSTGIFVTQGGSSASYTVGDLQDGATYAIFAWKDVNDTGEIDAGDLFGLYSTDGTNPAPVTVPATGIDLQLSVEGGDEDAPPDDDLPPTQGDLQGTWAGNGTTDSNDAYILTLDVTEVDTDAGAVSATVTLEGDLNGTVNVSGSFDGTTLTLSTPANDAQFTMTVVGDTMQGEGSVTLDDFSIVQLTFSLTKGGNAPPPDGEQSGEVTGTVSAPQGEQVIGTIIVLCRGQTCRATAEVQNGPDGTTAQFTLRNLTDGDAFELAAWQDKDGDGDFSDGDLLSEFAPVTVPATGVDLSMGYARANLAPGRLERPDPPTSLLKQLPNIKFAY